MDGQKEIFHYTYSASQQKEVEAIRKKYTEDTASDELDKMAQLRRLDYGVTRKASTASLSVGIISTLIMGCGMSLVMSDIGEMIGMTMTTLPGILIGVVGMIGVICAYPLYQYVLKMERRKIAPHILKLTEELSGR